MQCMHCHNCFQYNNLLHYCKKILFSFHSFRISILHSATGFADTTADTNPLADTMIHILRRLS